jgi:uncharacterized protein (TIGR02996 family)
MDTEVALLQALHENPADDTARLVLSDWLEENGQAQRAEQLRLHVALRNQPAARQRPAWEARVRELLAGGVLPCVPRLVNSVGIEFALIPPGKFRMGSPPREESRRSDEGPVHEVEITRPFYLGVHPVTQQQYERVTGKNPSRFAGSRTRRKKLRGTDTGTLPVDNLSWHNADALCRKLSELPEERSAGRVYRLPTEAEWEYACRGATSCSTPFHLGPSLSADMANFDGKTPYGGAPRRSYRAHPTPVGSFTPNVCGLYDMQGNIYEWCADWYGEDYYAGSPRQDPPGPAEGEQRVTRGGCWYEYGWVCRSAFRGHFAPDYHDHTFGVRLVLAWAEKRCQDPFPGETGS